MSQPSIVVSVADMCFEFAPCGCAFADTIFQGFGSLSSPNNPKTQIHIKVRLTDDIPPMGKEFIRFTAENEPDDECFYTKWNIALLPDGTEVITQECGEEENVRMARLSVRGSEGEMLISTTSPTGGVVDPLVSPLFSIFLSRQAQRRGGFTIHSSVVKASDGKGYLFTAVSGTGKSTMARIFGSAGGEIVNDDMNLIIPTPDGATAYNLPMRRYVQMPTSTPLHKLFLIYQSPDNKVQRVSGAAAVANLASNVIQQPFDAANALAPIDNVAHCFGGIPTYRLGFKPDKDIISLIEGL